MASELLIELETFDKRSALEVLDDEDWNEANETAIIEGKAKAKGRKSEWFTLYGEGQGDRGVILGKNPEGIYDEPTEAIWNSHAYQIGASFGGIRVHKRDVVLGLEVIDTPDATWQENDSELAKGWSFEADSRLWITTEKSRRYLELRKDKEPLFAPDTDPFQAQYGHIVYNLGAGFPRYCEQDYTFTTRLTPGEWAYVPVWNPTDIKAWPKWMLENQPGAVYEIADWSFGNGQYKAAKEHRNRTVKLPKLVAADKTVRVDTDSSEEQVKADGNTAIWLRMMGRSFLYGIPPYTGTKAKPVLLPIRVTGTNKPCLIQVRVPRHWSRPWGLE